MKRLKLKRGAYVILILLTLFAFILTDNAVALAFFVFLTVLAIGDSIVMLVLSRSVRLEIESQEARMRKTALTLRFTVHSKIFSLIGGVSISAVFENSAFGTSEFRTFYLKASGNETFTYEYLCENAGKLRMRFTDYEVVDIFGLCYAHCKFSYETVTTVSPVLYEDISLVSAHAEMDAPFGDLVSEIKRGQERAELTGVREFENGDGLRDVHWKLSGKYDRYLVKEFSAAGRFKTLILLDPVWHKKGYTANAEEINAIFDLAVSLSQEFLRAGIPHCVGWFSDAGFNGAYVYNGDSFLRMLSNGLGVQVEAEDRHSLYTLSSWAERDSFSRVLFLTPRTGSDELKILPSGQLTIIEASKEASRVDAGQDGIIRINPLFLGEFSSRGGGYSLKEEIEGKGHKIAQKRRKRYEK